jgi:hypothetical protein
MAQTEPSAAVVDCVEDERLYQTAQPLLLQRYILEGCVVRKRILSASREKATERALTKIAETAVNQGAEAA